MEHYCGRSRSLLKRALIVNRAVYSPGIGRFPICPVCDRPITHDGDLHEALITRGDAISSCQEEIFSPYNCVLLHHRCHMEFVGHGGEAILGKCVRHLVRWEGYEAVLAWLKQMRQVAPQAAAKALRRLEALDLGAGSQSEQSGTSAP